MERLRELGAEVSVHDLHVAGCERDLSNVVKGADVAAIAVAHDEYRSLDWEAIKPLFRTPIVEDGRNVCDSAAMERIGYRYRAVGQGERVAQ